MPRDGDAADVAQLVAEAVAELRVVVGVERLVDAAAHRPEEAGADVEAAVGRVAEVREQQAGRAVVVADRVVDVGQVEGRHALHLEDDVLRHDLVVDLDLRRARLKLQRGFGWLQEVKRPALDPVGVVVDALDAPASTQTPGST